MPRNLHLIIRDIEGLELAQMGLSNSLSTPLTEDYVASSKIDMFFDSKLSKLLSLPPIVVQVKN